MRLIVLAALVCASGCGQSSEGADGAGVGDDMAATSGDDLASSGGTLDLATPTSTKNATVTILAFSSPASASTTAGAAFTVGNLTASPGCTLTNVGHCIASACTIQAPTDGGTAPYTTVSGGTVTITGGPSPITLTESTMYAGYYPPFMATQAWFTGGESFTASSTGSVAPAFTLAFTTPHAPTMTPPPNNMFALSRTSDFTVTWSGSGAGIFVVNLQSNVQSTAPGTPFGNVNCTFPIGDGSGVVPAAAVAVIPVGTAMVSFGARTTTTTFVGEWLVTATAGTYAKTSAGDVYAGGQATVN